MDEIVNTFNDYVRKINKATDDPKGMYTLSFKDFSDDMLRYISSLECDICGMTDIRIHSCGFCKKIYCSDCSEMFNKVNKTVCMCPSKDTVQWSVFSHMGNYIQNPENPQIDITGIDQIIKNKNKLEFIVDTDSLVDISKNTVDSLLNQHIGGFTHTRFHEYTARMSLELLSCIEKRADLNRVYIQQKHILTSLDEQNILQLIDIWHPNNIEKYSQQPSGIISMEHFVTFYKSNFSVTERNAIYQYYTGNKTEETTEITKMYVRKIIDYIGPENILACILDIEQLFSECIYEISYLLDECINVEVSDLKTSSVNIIGIPCPEPNCVKGIVDVITKKCVECGSHFCTKCNTKLLVNKPTNHHSMYGKILDELMYSYNPECRHIRSRQEFYNMANTKEKKQFIINHGILKYFSDTSNFQTILNERSMITHNLMLSCQTLKNISRELQELDYRVGKDIKVKISETVSAVKKNPIYCPNVLTRLFDFPKENGPDNDAENVINEHVCIPKNVPEGNNIMIRKCPMCAVNISKVENTCDVMFCINCNTKFNWLTGDVGVGGENRELTDYMKQLTNNKIKVQLTLDYGDFTIFDDLIPLSFFEHRIDTDLFKIVLFGQISDVFSPRIKEVMNDFLRKLEKIAIEAYRHLNKSSYEHHSDIEYFNKIKYIPVDTIQSYNTFVQDEYKKILYKSLLQEVNLIFFFLHRWIVYVMNNPDSLVCIEQVNDQLVKFITPRFPGFILALNHTISKAQMFI
ncbi:divergent RING-finger protein [Salmon gill poxvirus]